MLTYDLERRGDLPRYDYLYRCIKGDILSGLKGAGGLLCGPGGDPAEPPSPSGPGPGGAGAALAPGPAGGGERH